MSILTLVSDDKLTQELRLMLLNFYDNGSRKFEDFMSLAEVAHFINSSDDKDKAKRTLKILNTSLANANLIRKTNFMQTRAVTYETTNDGRLILDQYKEKVS